MASETSSERERSGAIARAFVQARRDAVALPGFPGSIPATIEDAYHVQALAIAQWPDRVVGWKVGYIAPELREPGGDERLVGPFFARALQHAAPGGTLDFPVFDGGFAAVEAELVFRLGADAPPDQRQWTPAQAAEIATHLHIGIETAGSPLATINDLGPRVVVSDFGNNAGMLLGPKIDGWRALSAPVLRCTTYVDGIEAGSATVETLEAGPLAALAFALSRCARNGRPLRAGDLVTTGALTGIHEVVAGQSARVDFGTFGSIACRAVPAHRAGPV
jgi:2-keto-4-pentenoate hydratase